MEYIHISHPFEPVFDEKSQILILGSFPSVKSRENAFYCGHPRNRFWAVLAAVLDCDIPSSIEEKKDMLLSHRIAVWDVISECDISGSDDSSIKNAVPNDIAMLIKKAPIRHVYTNGKTAHRLYCKYLERKTGLTAISLPSTSPANAAYSLNRLIDIWSIINGSNSA